MPQQRPAPPPAVPQLLWKTTCSATAAAKERRENHNLAKLKARADAEDHRRHLAKYMERELERISALYKAGLLGALP